MSITMGKAEKEGAIWLKMYAGCSGGDDQSSEVGILSSRLNPFLAASGRRLPCRQHDSSS